jgi:hypothetical protein
MKEDARDLSFFNFFLEAWQKRLIYCQRLGRFAFGCIFILQAAQTQNVFLLYFTLCHFRFFRFPWR